MNLARWFSYTRLLEQLCAFRDQQIRQMKAEHDDEKRLWKAREEDLVNRLLLKEGVPPTSVKLDTDWNEPKSGLNSETRSGPRSIEQRLIEEAQDQEKEFWRQERERMMAAARKRAVSE